MNTQLINAPQASPLQFSSSAECARWVEQLPLTNVQQAQRLLNSQVTALHAADLPAIERLKILEILRQPIAFVQGECANRYLGRPLPLEPSEVAIWQDVIALWHGVTGNYQQCLGEYRSGEVMLAPHAALITARLMRLIGCQMIEHYHVYQQVPGELWTELNALYLAAEQFDFLHSRVPSSLHQPAPESSCAEAYLHALLAHLANPYALSARQVGLMVRWLERWTGLVKLARDPQPMATAPAVAVDLDGIGGATFASDLSPAANPRYVDVEDLARALRQTITALKKGQTPAQLGLEGNLHQPGCESLLMLLYVQWCRAGTVRIEERDQAEEDADICFSLPASHFQLRGGREFRQPGELTSREKRDLDTFGYIIRAGGDAAERDQFPLTACKIGNHSPSGFLCVMRDLQALSRVNHNQLIVVRRGTPGEYRVGLVQWLKFGIDGELRCGVRLLPGEPRAVAVRPAHPKEVGNRYERALLLAADAVTATPATLILPSGWFQSGALIEIVTERHQVATMLTLLEKGSDFDRGTVTLT